ncbi:KH domain-containing protein [bacterium]|uniref:KH domain-containing protein n=1 Tax=Candidatus Ventrenecus sp. TaxID=3085654 RepID=UPI001DD508C3|nr:KH domain-containing protein [bacterium]
MKSLEEYTEILVKSIIKKPDLLKVSTHDIDGTIKLDILVPQDVMGSVIGKNGRTIHAIRTLISLYAYKENLPKVEVNVESF